MYLTLTEALRSKGANVDRMGNKIYIGNKGVFSIRHGVSDYIFDYNFQGAVITKEPFYMVFELRNDFNERKITIPIEVIERDNLRVEKERFHSYVIYELYLGFFRFNGKEYDGGRVTMIIDPPIKEKVMEYGRKAYEFYMEHPEEVKTAMKIGAMLLL